MIMKDFTMASLTAMDIILKIHFIAMIGTILLEIGSEDVDFLTIDTTCLQTHNIMVFVHQETIEEVTLEPTKFT